MEINPLIQERLKKREGIQKSGLPAYAQGFERNILAEEAKNIASEKVRTVEEITKNPKAEYSLAGRLMTFREHGKISFGQLQDISGRVQICFMRDLTSVKWLTEDHENFWKKKLDLGDFLGVKGDIFRTQHGEITILVREIELLSKAIRPLPEKWHGLTDRESCYRERYLDLLTNEETFQRFQIRTEVIKEIRKFLDEKGFQEVETRVLQPQAGGAMAEVFETHHNALDQKFVLRISLELDHKMLIAGGIERLYEIGKCFRNEGMDPSHLQEFTLLEWYAAYATLEDNMEWTEDMIKHIIQKVVGKMELEVLDKDEKLVMVDFGKKWKRVRFPDVLKEYSKLDMLSASLEEIQKKAKEYGMSDEEIRTTSRGNILDHIYKKSARPHLIEPTFVLDYPSELKPLARPREDGTAEVYQLLIAGWEIVNSYGELVDPVIQRKLLEEQSQAKKGGDEAAMEIDESFLKAMEHGLPPMTGFGMGIDRFVALITEQPNLRDVVLLPLMKPLEKKEVSESGVRSQESGVQTASSKRKEKSNEEILKTDEKSKKFVIVLNKKVEIGRLFNAVGHIMVGLGAGSTSDLHLLEYSDEDGGIHPHISHFGVIALKADNSNQIRTLREQAIKAGIEYNDFTSTMTIGTSENQFRSTAETKEADLEYYGICLFGDAEKIDPLTKKFSLWR
ncbi:lysine--tRNA ligase [Candidatus Peregrinibacteria bacterium]|nr:lysine--tRNA ligase [Candidatus Peregrinibacteria bacterium]